MSSSDGASVVSEWDNILYRMAMEDPVPWYRKKNLRHLYLLLFPCVIGIEMTSGFDSQIINAVQIVPKWREYFGDPCGADAGLLAAGLSLGACLSLPFIPYINDNFGRRWCIMFGSTLMIIGSIIQGFCSTAPVYIFARITIGFGLPFAIVAGSCLLGELGYPKERPILTSLFNACFSLGAIVAAAVTFGTTTLVETEWSWRIPSLLQMAPSLLQVTLVFFLPESPRYLISKDRHEEALQILIKYHGEGDENSAFVKAEMAEIETTIAMELEHSKQSWFDMVRTAGMRRRVMIGGMLGMFTQLSGNVVISYYLYDCLKLLNFTNTGFQAKFNIGSQVWSLVCGVVASLIVMRFRRRTMYLTGIAGIFVVYMSWTICAALAVEQKNTVAAQMSLFWILAYSPAYSISFNALTYTFLVELFPYAQRARGIAIFQLFGKAAQFFGTYVNPIGLFAIGWKFLLVYCCWILVEALIVYVMWPETSGRTLEELAFLFEDPVYTERTTEAVEKMIHSDNTSGDRSIETPGSNDDISAEERGHYSRPQIPLPVLRKAAST